MEPIIHHSCGIVLINRDNSQIKYLLLKYPHGHIDFAKGHIDPGETLIQCAKRELAEETSITDVQIIDGFFEQINYTYQEDSKSHYKTVDYFLAETDSTDVKVSHEHTGFMWCDFETALKELSFDNARTLLIKAQAFLDL